jgi:Ser/Thr protein kinase RdoA (MazF antagonist)
MASRSGRARFTKPYSDAAACRLAAANYRWLASLPGPLRLPNLLEAGRQYLGFAFVAARPASPADLVPLAAHLGDVHGAAYAAELHQASLDAPYATTTGHRIPDFLTPRLDTVRRRLESGTVPGPGLDAADAHGLMREAAQGPAALYKDANPRSFLVTDDGPPVTVDFDDLTLAPFGYDLAKLVVTLTMTHGPLCDGTTRHALDAYNMAAHRHRPSLGHVTGTQLLAWAEIHHVLTSPYLGRRGYRHGWHTLRPARFPAAAAGKGGHDAWP